MSKPSRDGQSAPKYIIVIQNGNEGREWWWELRGGKGQWFARSRTWRMEHAARRSARELAEALGYNGAMIDWTTFSITKGADKK